MNIENYHPDILAFQQLTTRLHWASQRRLMRALEVYNLTLPQFMALRTISRSKNESCSMTELSQDCFQVLATTSGIISRLCERNLVERYRDPSDRRSQRVSLTEQGQHLLDAIDNAQLKRIEVMLQGFSVQERDLFMALMEKYLQITLTEMEEQLDE